LDYYFPTISQIKQITPELLISLRECLIKDGKHAWNINRILSALKAMMRYAEASRLIDPQIWRLVRMIPTPKGRLAFWQEGEIKTLYVRCKGIWETIARLAIEAGLRREEIHTLKVASVDFRTNRINIVGDETWTPKSCERRSVPMKPTLSKHLKKVMNGSVHVLGDDRPNLDVMTSYFRKLVRKAGLDGSLHKGRHTYAALQAMKGIPLAVIRDRLGHGSIKTTEIYAHLCVNRTDELYEA
jgi:integrase